MVGGKIIVMKKVVFIMILLFSSKLLSHGPTVIGHDGWSKTHPSELNVSVYDPILNSIEPQGFKGHGNVGAGIDGEVLFWDTKEICGLVSFVRVYDYEWAADASGFLGEKLKKLVHNVQDELPNQILNNYCSLYNPEKEDRKFQSELIEIITKKKGTKGHKEIVRYQQFKYDNNLTCLFYAGGLQPFVSGYYKGLIIGWICVKDEDYFSKEKIKKITKSLGVYNFVDPPQSYRLDIHK